MAGHRVTMTFSVAIEPRGEQTARLAEMLGETVRVEIGVEADLLAEKGGSRAGTYRMNATGATPEDIAAPWPFPGTETPPVAPAEKPGKKSSAKRP
jgi:hypothetical protein